MQVHKFGGASICSAEAIKHMAGIVGLMKEQSGVLVVSAMGKTTNALEEVVDAFWRGEDANAKLEKVRQFHADIVSQLGLGLKLWEDLNDIFVEAEWLLEDEVNDTYDFIYDQVVSIGELLASRIVQEELKNQGVAAGWMDVRGLIRTDDQYRNGSVDWSKTEELVKEHLTPQIKDQWIVTQGFIAGTQENTTTTLGREGSDYSAAILAASLSSPAVTIWKDVPGVMSADPHVFSEVELLPKLSYQEAVEMTYYGAKVIHPKTIKPLMERQIPLYVKPFSTPEATGTEIAAFSGLEYPPISVQWDHLTLLRITTRDVSFIIEDELRKIFGLLGSHHIHLHVMQNLALSFTVVVHPDPVHLPALMNELAADFNVERRDDVRLLTQRHDASIELPKHSAGATILLQSHNGTTSQWVLAN